MINVLGYELSAATALLEKEGFAVETEEARSRKGQPGNEKRVIRQVQITGATPCVQLTYAVFQTVVSTEEYGD